MAQYLNALFNSKLNRKKLFVYSILLIAFNFLILCAYLQLTCDDNGYFDSSSFAGSDEERFCLDDWLAYALERIPFGISHNQKVEFDKIARLIKQQLSISNKTFRTDIIEEPIYDLKKSQKADSKNTKFKLDNCWPLGEAKSKRYVLLDSPGVGYANRLYAFLTAVTIAMLTKSQLVMNWKSIEDYIDIIQPESPNERIILNPKYQIISNDNTENLIKYEYNTITSQAWLKNKNITTILNSEIVPSYLLSNTNSSIESNKTFVINIRGYNAQFFELLASRSTSAFTEALADCGLVDKQVLAEAKKEINLGNINVMFGLGFSLAHNVLNQIWTPSSKSVRQQLDIFMSDNDFENSYVIGVQLRSEFLSDDSDVTNMIKCAVEVERAYLAKQMSTNTTYKKSVKWFLSSDSHKNLRHLKRNLNKRIDGKVISTRGRIAHINSFGGYERAVLDNEVLSLCDEIIITGGSTFGMYNLFY
jgi:hypothetical protein